MDDSTIYALVALIISIIALFIAVLQTFVSIFVTADGARRCRPSIIGKWSRLTKWHWNLSEFRYEIKFTTPDLQLIPIPEFFLNGPTQEHSPFFYKGAEAKGRHRWQAKLHVLSYGTLPYDIEDEWKGAHHARRSAEKIKTTWKWLTGNDDRYDNASMVGWNQLTRMVFLYQEHARKLRLEVPWEMRNASTQQKSPLAGDTAIAVQLRQQTWDIMPPEIVRPLARSNLGTVLVMAQRLGMRWRHIDLGSVDPILHAEGDGYHLSSTTLPALGTVLRFNQAKTITVPQLVAGEVADKLMCGTLPGCADLGLGDKTIIDKHREKRVLHETFRLMGFGKQALETLKEDAWYFSRMVMNDLIALHCPFVPSPQSPVTKILYPVYWSKPSPWSGAYGYYLTPLQQWEGRKIYLHALKRRLDTWSTPDEQPQTMRMAYDHFKALSTNGNLAEFYCWEDKPNITTQMTKSEFGQLQDAPRPDPILKAKSFEATVKMIADLKAIHDATTAYFAARYRPPPDSIDAGNSDKTHNLSTTTTATLDPSTAALNDQTHTNLSDSDADASLHSSTTTQIPLSSTSPSPTPHPKPRHPQLNFTDLLSAHIDALAESLHKSQTDLDKLHKSQWPDYTDPQIIRGKRKGLRGPHLNHAMCHMASRFVTVGREEVLHKLKQVGYGPNARKGLETDEFELEGAWWMLLVRGIAWRMSVQIEKPDPECMVPRELYASEFPVWIT